MRRDFATRLIILTLCLVLVICVVQSQPAALVDDVIPQDKAVGEVVGTGKTNTNTSMTPSGELRFDSVASQMTGISDLWVNAVSGNDGNHGLTPATAFRTIQRAADIAGPGTTVHILPGIYRETVRPRLSGSAAEPVVYRAENGPGTVIIRGSERADTLAWSQLATNSIGLPPGVSPGNLYYADVSAWALNGPPRFVVQLGDSGETVTRLPLAREPDWQVRTEWKYHEFWWAADGGSTVAACDPASDPDPDCDLPWRSTTQLTDRNSDGAPAGIEPGNLTTLADLTGATVVAMDTVSGHYVYRRTIISHDVGGGRVTVDEPCEFDRGSGKPGLGWGSKYYLENHPALMDTPGEWWYDANNFRLYLWPPVPGNPATLNIEISRHNIGFELSDRSYITLDGLTMEFFDDNAVHQSQSCPGCGSYHNTVRNATLRYANVGIRLGQGVEDAASITDGFTLENSEIAQMDSNAIHLNYWWPGQSADSFTHAGIVNTVIRNNELHHLGFRSWSDDADGIQFNYADKLRFEGNYVHHVAHNGTLLGRSVIQSAKEWGFSPEEIKTGEILIKDNVFEKACLLATDCGEVKIWGSPPDTHVFRDLLITGNVFRNTFGWTYISEKRGRWSGGTSSDVQGMGGFGLYLDHSSGIHAYRNIAYNNASSGFHFYNRWWDGDIIYYNNVAANSLNGIRLDGWASRGSTNTQIANNTVVNNEGYGILNAQGDYGNILVDYNLYYDNGWRPYEDGGVWHAGDMAIYGPGEYYQTLAAIQASTPWEDHGVEGDPGFWDYDVADHGLFDGSWPDFHLTSASANALDRGTTALPDSLIALLDAFEVNDFRGGQAYDIGRYERGFAVLASRAVQFVSPGGVAFYVLRLDPPDLPHPVTLTVTSPPPLLDIGLSSPILTADEVVTLTVTDSHIGPMILPALAYTVPITATGGGFAETTIVRLFVGGARVYLPIILKMIWILCHFGGWRFDTILTEMSFSHVAKAFCNTKGYYEIDNTDDLAFHPQQTWPQELWVKWAFIRAGHSEPEVNK